MHRQLTVGSALFLLCALAPSVVANPPGVFVMGHFYHEEFSSGLDRPEVVSETANLEFNPGFVRLLEGGLIAYEFDFDPIDTNWGTYVPAYGSFSVVVDDQLRPGSELKVEFVCGPDDVSPHAYSYLLRYQITDEIVRVTSRWHGELHELEFSRATGLSALGGDILSESYRWSPQLEIPGGISENERIQLFNMQPGPSPHPLRLEIRGVGFDIHTVETGSYTFVGTASSSWGGIKAMYEQSPGPLGN